MNVLEKIFLLPGCGDVRLVEYNDGEIRWVFRGMRQDNNLMNHEAPFSSYSSMGGYIDALGEMGAQVIMPPNEFDRMAELDRKRADKAGPIAVRVSVPEEFKAYGASQWA